VAVTLNRWAADRAEHGEAQQRKRCDITPVGLRFAQPNLREYRFAQPNLREYRFAQPNLREHRFAQPNLR
jgi:hypothetical protein